MQLSTSKTAVILIRALSAPPSLAKLLVPKKGEKGYRFGSVMFSSLLEYCYDSYDYGNDYACE